MENLGSLGRIGSAPREPGTHYRALEHSAAVLSWNHLGSHSLPGSPSKEGDLGGCTPVRPPSIPLSLPPSLRRSALGLDSGRAAARTSVPGVLSPAPRSGDVREAVVSPVAAGTMRLRPLPLVVVPGLLQLVSGGPGPRAPLRFRRETPIPRQSQGLLGTWVWGAPSREFEGAWGKSGGSE